MSLETATIGLAEPVHDSQAVFRVILDAMSRPGSIHPLPLGPSGAPFAATAAAVLLTLADHETTVWLAPDLPGRDEVASFLRFTTGTRITSDPDAATFALVADLHTMPPLEAFAQGTPEYPDRSTTLVMIVDRIKASASGLGMSLSGPGIAERAEISFDPMPARLALELLKNRACFPLGVDLVLCAPGAVAALPRSVRYVGA